MPSEMNYEQNLDTPPSGVCEQDIEDQFIAKLCDLKYTYRSDIRDRASLERNFRQKFETLNRVRLTDAEFQRLLDDLVSADVFKNAVRLREKNDFERDDGTPLSYTLVNIRDWCKNDFEVVHQLRINTDYSHHRYDVLLLINGVPVVQVELKTLGVSPRRAMQQIADYKADAGNGYTRTLLCFVQLFIVSNRDSTFYFANNNARHFAFDAEEQFLPVYKWANRENKPIVGLAEFADAFLPKCDLGRMISRYMVLIQSEQKLLMMRPYQIYAVQSIVDCIDQNNGNGYIWHTTGSGKTLTSFKASTLLRDNPAIDKCLFVVDRKDLDRQTREEFNRFQEGCVEANTNTATLVDRLLSEDKADKVIVTTIQKLGLALDESSKRNRQREKRGLETYRERLEPLRDKRVVLIFDECHRSQFGDNHDAIKAFFPRAQLFGFTGTPIFDDNATRIKIDGNQASYRTTVETFQRELHSYTITHAIEDRNVLKFHVDYYKLKGEETPKPGRVLEKQAVVRAILDNHDAVTHARRFNALLATASIDDAIEYHGLFQNLQDERVKTDPDFVPLKIAAVFSPPVPPSENDKNAKDIAQLQEDLPTEQENNRHNPEEKRAALVTIIDAYNARYRAAHTVSEFDLYYQDVQQRIKDQRFPNADLPRRGAEKIDVTIVVDMLLTGFDSKYLNTLYVDKTLKHHGLIQAFSRTNRIINATKPHGHVLDFRQQESAVNEAIFLFSGLKTKEAAREIWLVESAPEVVKSFTAAVGKLTDFMRSQELQPVAADVPKLSGDEARATFIERFRDVQRLKTQLDQYTDLSPELRTDVERILPKDDLTAFRGAYLETARDLKARQGREDDTVSPIVEALDFEFVLFASADIDYDYIMGLCARFTQQQPKEPLKLNREQLIGIIAADAKFVDEREIITDFVHTLEPGQRLDEKEVAVAYRRFRENFHAAALAKVADKHRLPTERLQAFVDTILQRLVFDGEQLTELLAPLGLNWKARRVAELALMEDLVPLLKQRAAGRDISGLNAYET
ncbi:type I restriction endonuclease subunit R [Opitutus terrae]|uniref:Type I restriction enzyme endonuclease subunit n=1 Tax=Opitutus terrae (strain DSM 11246 / JCM 15787 / PB90-1) TaxID=452637 RepID=B1ZMN1_OPITP|nr:type I restriction endonuclease subunit R [Opitutus terrae]ACB74376.1 type I site-specific deoxyribonuclease, HsdR family [Opitutus terrae PB90-1]